MQKPFVFFFILFQLSIARDCFANWAGWLKGQMTRVSHNSAALRVGVAKGGSCSFLCSIVC